MNAANRNPELLIGYSEARFSHEAGTFPKLDITVSGVITSLQALPDPIPLAQLEDRVKRFTERALKRLVKCRKEDAA